MEIHRDGPGHLAIIDLPYGVEASDVTARRGRLASGLRLPLDYVWPEPAPGHTGRLALWVGSEHASQMRQSAWPLLKGSRVDVFKPFPFATTPHMDVVNASLMYGNWLLGGQPGSGKTLALAVDVGPHSVAHVDWLHSMSCDRLVNKVGEVASRDHVTALAGALRAMLGPGA
ncbi:hypothetical protein [Actinoallomurus sp. CA-142502]|uniref:hypothetical protein n=1 Tax=Actinoallomurus sp. CA-142502 TaxID=3239885 RepID=UPI003D8FDC5C